MSSTSTPAPPPFSYAQAARGFQSGAASSQKSTDVSAASSEKGARGRQSSSTDGEKLENRPKSSDASPGEIASQSTTKLLEAPRTYSIISKEVVEKDTVKDPKHFGSSEENKTIISPTTVSLSESEQSGNHKDDEISIGPNGVSEAWERQSEASTSVEKGNVMNEKDKLQAGDDDWEKVSAPSLSQERELKAAPPPTVNIWQQRMQTQEAKQREQASQRPVSSGGKVSTASGPVADSTKIKSSEKVASAQEREAASKRKPVDATKTVTEKPGPPQPAQGRPSSRGQQSGPKLPPPPPPVGDAVTWPTPYTATEADERRKPSTETNEKVEVKPSGAKQQKKWTQVPFVPTAVFNTPLPPAAAKRGGRGAIRGARDGTGRNGHMTQNSVSGDKSDLGTSMGPPPLPRQGDQERGRRPDATRGGRATSVPTHRRRSASTATTQVESRKASGFGHNPAGPVPGEGLASGNAQESRSSSRPTDASSRANLNANVDTPDPSLASENTHSHPIVDPVARASIPPEWYGKPGGGITKPTGEQSTKERNQPRTRTFQESRDKVESWRDRDSQADATIRRESRNERSGRGTYRGRGNNAGYASTNSQHAYTAPLPQQPFASHKSHSYNDSRQRQSSQPYPMQPVSVGGRQNLRSQSIPMQDGIPPLSPIQTDISGMYGYYPGQMLPGLMGPLPHNPALDMYGLMALVTAQLDYYFSIDNLCRDLYLRKHMDSQGFVSLRFLGDFKRITSMTRDMEMLRISAVQSKILELRQGDDGEDRVRRRDGWEQWVLSNMEERDASARNAGPSAQSYQPRRPQYGQYPGFAESPYPIAGPMRSPSWGVTGYNDVSGIVSPGFPQAITTNEHDMNEHATPFHGPDSGINGDRDNTSVPQSGPQGHSRSSSFVPAMNGPKSSTVTNGHDGASQSPEMPGSDQENVFPNDKVHSVWVYARKGEDDAPPFASHATRTLSQGSRGGMDASGNGLTSPTFVSGLRGGAASPEQIQRLHSRDSLPLIDPTKQNGTFFLKEGVSQNDFDREGSDPWPYQVLHGKAVDQRDKGLHGPENHEMEILYQFWPTFLIQNFNAAMYKDFYRFALEDLSRGSINGSTHLARYYGYQLSADKPLSDQVAHDIVAAIGQENGDARPVFQKVRAFWRDGAFNFKSRKRIDNLLDAGLREELGK